MPAPVQITAEQLLREAKERELELVPPVSQGSFSSKNKYLFTLSSYSEFCMFNFLKIWMSVCDQVPRQAV